MERSIVERIGARLFINPFGVHTRRDTVMVVVMLHNLTHGHFPLNDAGWQYFAFDVLPFAITRTIKVSCERRRREEEWDARVARL